MEEISKEEFERKIKNLLVRSNLHGLPAKRKDLLVFLRMIISLFKEENYTEKQVNGIIKDFISKVPGIKVDHVKIRRALVDEEFLIRTPSGSSYTVNRDCEALKKFSSSINELDCLSFINEARKEIEERRKKYTQQSK